MGTVTNNVWKHTTFHQTAKYTNLKSKLMEATQLFHQSNSNLLVHITYFIVKNQICEDKKDGRLPAKSIQTCSKKKKNIMVSCIFSWNVSVCLGENISEVVITDLSSSLPTPTHKFLDIISRRHTSNEISFKLNIDILGKVFEVKLSVSAKACAYPQCQLSLNNAVIRTRQSRYFTIAAAVPRLPTSCCIFFPISFAINRLSWTVQVDN